MFVINLSRCPSVRVSLSLRYWLRIKLNEKQNRIKRQTKQIEQALLYLLSKNLPIRVNIS